VVSARISLIAGDDDLKKNSDQNTKSDDARAILELTDLQKAADTVASDLMGYRLRIKDLKKYETGFEPCDVVIGMKKKTKKGTGQDTSLCSWVTSKKDDSTVYHSMVTRPITYSLNSFNLVLNSQQGIPDSSKKKLLASIPINFGDNEKSATSGFRWEASAGAFFSSLPIRSFSVAPVFTNGVITDKVISQNVLYPTVVPFAAANYRPDERPESDSVEVKPLLDWRGGR